MERKYLIRPEAKEYIKQNKITNRIIALKLGITEGYVSQIITGKKTNISKMMAYAFCKAINNEFEIGNLFEIIEWREK